MNPNAKLEVGKILDSGYIGQGPKVEEFEHNLRDYFNSDRVVTLNSGTSGLHLAIHLLKKPRKAATFIGDEFYNHDWPGLRDGDEVLSTALTCTASNFPTLANNLSVYKTDTTLYKFRVNARDKYPTRVFTTSIKVITTF